MNDSAKQRRQSQRSVNSYQPDAAISIVLHSHRPFCLVSQDLRAPTGSIHLCEVAPANDTPTNSRRPSWVSSHRRAVNRGRFADDSLSELYHLFVRTFS